MTILKVEVLFNEAARMWEVVVTTAESRVSYGLFATKEEAVIVAAFTADGTEGGVR